MAAYVYKHKGECIVYALTHNVIAEYSLPVRGRTGEAESLFTSLSNNKGQRFTTRSISGFCFLYFGANTIWFGHLHFKGDKL